MSAIKNPSEKQVYDYLTGRLGFSHEDAAAIMGNLVHENAAVGRRGFNTTRTGDRGASIGLAQWQGSRRRELERMDNWQDYRVQLDFMAKELKRGPYRNALKGKTVRQKTRQFSRVYERPGTPHYKSRYSIADRVASRNFRGETGTSETMVAGMDMGGDFMREMMRSLGIDLNQTNTRKADREDLPNVKQAANDVLADVMGAYDVQPISGYRSPGHNRRVGGAKKSQHLHGNAVDIDVSQLSKDQREGLLQDLAADPRVGGIGSYRNSVHFDVRPFDDIASKAIWGPSYSRDSAPPELVAAVTNPIEMASYSRPAMPQVQTANVVPGLPAAMRGDVQDIFNAAFSQPVTGPETQATGGFPADVGALMEAAGMAPPEIPVPSPRPLGQSTGQIPVPQEIPDDLRGRAAFNRLEQIDPASMQPSLAPAQDVRPYQPFSRGGRQFADRMANNNRLAQRSEMGPPAPMYGPEMPDDSFSDAKPVTANMAGGGSRRASSGVVPEFDTYQPAPYMPNPLSNFDETGDYVPNRRTANPHAWADEIIPEHADLPDEVAGATKGSETGTGDVAKRAGLDTEFGAPNPFKDLTRPADYPTGSIRTARTERVDTIPPNALRAPAGIDKEYPGGLPLGAKVSKSIPGFRPSTESLGVSTSEDYDEAFSDDPALSDEAVAAELERMEAEGGVASPRSGFLGAFGGLGAAIAAALQSGGPFGSGSGIDWGRELSNGGRRGTVTGTGWGAYQAPGADHVSFGLGPTGPGGDGGPLPGLSLYDADGDGGSDVAGKN